MAKTAPAGGPSRLKIKLILVTIVGVASLYLVFSYKKEFFPFTVENKKKIEEMLKGKGKKGKGGEDDELSLLEREIQEEMRARQEGELDELLKPTGGTGGIDLEGKGGLGEPSVKGDETMTALYQQQLFRQLFLPYEDMYQQEPGCEGPDCNRTFMPIARGGDLPRSGEDVPSALQFPFPIDERLYELYGLYPPGGTYRGNLGDYPYYWGYPTNAEDDEDEGANLARTLKKANRASAYLGNVMSPNQRQLAFSQLQKHATRMNKLNDPPVVRRGYRSNVLPPVVAKRHMATPIRLS